MEDRNTRNPDSDSDLIQQLREKIRTQATRLRNLEQYRVLCEQRITELSPGHTLPVRPEDLGTGQATLSQDLMQAKQKIARLEQQIQSNVIKVPLGENYTFPPPTTQLSMAQLQELYSAIYYQHHDLIKEKNAVEEGLRNEMLTCEEQRAYIEVLKQTLESNLQDLGLSGRNLNEFLTKEPGANLKEILDSKIEECDRLIEEREKTDKHLKEAAEALQYAEEEVERLEEEKSNLLDYIEEHGQKEKQQGDEIRKLRQEYFELENIINQSKRELDSETNLRIGLEREVENIKIIENEYEKARKDLKNFEAKHESLQLNNATLSNTLKETQEELDSLRSKLDGTLKELSSIRRSASISDSKVEEVQGRSDKLTEVNKELEVRLNRAEKELKNFKERKVKEIENEFQSQVEQLTVEIQDLRKELDSSKDKEKSLLKELAESKKKVKKIQEDLEKNAVSSSQSGQDILSLKKSLETCQIEVRQVTFEKDKLNSDIQKLEFDLKTEKSTSLLLEEQADSLKKKLEENSKSLKNLSDSNREKDNKLQNSTFEIENLNKNLQVILKDLESERSLKVQYYDEVLKLKKTQIALSQSGSAVAQCKKFIEEFSSNFGAVSSASNSYSQVVSSQFKDQIFKSNEVENIDLQEWVQVTCEELESLIRRLAEYKQDLSMTTQKLQSTQHRLDSLSLDEGALRDRERSLRLQLEQLTNDKEKLQCDREVLTNKLQSAQAELSGIKKEVQVNNEESQRLRDQLAYTTCETVQWRNTAESDIFAIRSVEEKANLLLKEKKELESLLSKLQSAVPSNDLQRVFLEMMKVHSELEVVNRERLRIENSLLRTESEMRSLSRNHKQEKAVQARKEVENLRGQLVNSDSQIMSYKRRMMSLDEELKDIEKAERRRSMVGDSEKGYLQDLGTVKEIGMFDLKKRVESFDRPGSIPGLESFEDRPLLSYFDKLRRARNLVSDLRDQE